MFANVQTGNVIFFAVDLSERKLSAGLAHVWPTLAFLAGVALSSHIKSGRVDQFLVHPPRWIMGIQATVLAVIGFVPATVPHSYVTVPISFVAALQIGLFRSIGDLAYLPVATTGNLKRLMESGYDGFVEKERAPRRTCAIYGALIASFAAGALAGAFATGGWGVRIVG